MRRVGVFDYYQGRAGGPLDRIRNASQPWQRLLIPGRLSTLVTPTAARKLLVEIMGVDED
jgi:hypothetical protein